ncbi:hypothetical protein COD67_19595 [Bacillus cereus]|nr:hypothetical protein COI89_20395 [Bacillus cereus]PGU63885.1 hypothetical protein COD67_19595 [Bacillus cereus]
MKKLGLIVLGLSCVGVLSFGVSNDSSQLYAYGDYPVPQRPDLAYSDGNTGGISKLEAHGNHGGAPTYDHGRPPAPAYEYGDIHMDHGEHI